MLNVRLRSLAYRKQPIYQGTDVNDERVYTVVCCVHKAVKELQAV